MTIYIITKWHHLENNAHVRNVDWISGSDLCLSVEGFKINLGDGMNEVVILIHKKN